MPSVGRTEAEWGYDLTDEQGDRMTDDASATSGSESLACLVATGLWLEEVERLSAVLEAAGIQFQLVEHRGFGFCCYVPAEQGGTALTLLEDAGVIPQQIDTGSAVVSVSGGACPACGMQIRPGTKECPECRLVL